jgi:hypothetical protein
MAAGGCDGAPRRIERAHPIFRFAHHAGVHSVNAVELDRLPARAAQNRAFAWHRQFSGRNERVTGLRATRAYPRVVPI